MNTALRLGRANPAWSWYACAQVNRQVQAGRAAATTGPARTALCATCPQAYHIHSLGIRDKLLPVLSATQCQHKELQRQQYLPSQHRHINLIASKAGKGSPETEAGMQSSSTEAEQFSLLQTSSAQWDEATKTAAGWRQRASANVRESLLLTYTTLVESVLVTIADTLRLSALLNWLTPRLEGAIAAATGSKHRLSNGKCVPFSLVNNTAPDFSMPGSYHAADFPFADSPSYHPAVSHMLALSMKLVYERPEVIKDIAEEMWGLSSRAYVTTGMSASDKLYLDPQDKARFEPHTRTMVLETERAIIVAFRGSEPTNLINFRSSGRIALLPQPGLGRVHAGFWTCLFYGDAEGGTLHSRLVEALNAVQDTSKPIYLTGHSLGAALAILFAAAAHAQNPSIASRIAAVYVFAAPRVGDADFASACEAAYPERIHRLVHASDIVPRVPPKFLEYAHCGRERFITSFGGMVTEPADIRRWHRIEGIGFLPLYVYKLGAGVLSRGEGLRTLYRLVLLFILPGLADHWPSDYEQWVRKDLQQRT